MAANLKQRHQTWYVRVGINPKYRDLFGGRTETVRSLGTRDKRKAEQMKHGMIQLIKNEHARVISEAGLVPQDPQWLLKVTRPIRQEMAAGNIDYDTGSMMIEQLREQHINAVTSRTERKDGEQAREDARKAGLTEPEYIPSASMDAIRTVYSLLRDPSAKSLEEAIDEHLEHAEKTVINSTYKHKAIWLKDFLSHVGNRLVTDVDRRTASRYVNDVLAANGRSPAANRKSLSVLTTFFDWLELRGYYEDLNPFARQGAIFKGSRKGSESRSYRAWNKDERTRLFEYLDGCKPGTVKHKAGIVGRISLYTGMRLDEICAMKLDAVNVEERMLSVIAGKRDNSVRQVYIPDQLLPLISELKDSSGDDYLITGLKSGGDDMKRGHSLGNRASEVKTELFPDAGRRLAFHGLRSTFITAAESSGVPEATTKLLVGHARQSLTYGLYSKGPHFEILIEPAQRAADWLDAN